ncbi:MAG: hypothetical protein J0L92_04910 [Deltaproteobacteria bacterium]|nr:hypothetical protein [Deltaproteobacteria bacterium]
MTETLGERRRRGEDDATAPFVLDRSSVRPPTTEPPPTHETGASPNPDEHAHDEHDGVVDLVSRRSIPSSEPLPAPAATSRANDTRRLDKPGRRAARWLAWALVVDALVLLTLAFTSLGRLLDEGAGAPDLLIGSVSLVLALPCVLGARHLAGVGRRTSTPTHDAHGFAQGIGHLRALFVIKATVLFMTLGLGCFAFWLIASLLALL